MNWKEYLYLTNIDEEEKILLWQYGDSIETKGFPVIFDLIHLAQILQMDVFSFASVVNSPTSFYRHFSIPKRRDGELRSIAAPYPILAEIQHWIKREILEKLPLHQSCFSYRRELSIVDNAKVHLSKSVLYKIDLKDFFPSINLRRIISVFQYCGYSNKVSFFLSALCSLDNSLPQGAATSPILSNIIGKRMDIRLSKLSIKFEINYSRYADDLTFSGEYISNNFRNIVKKIIKNEGFEINPKKEILIIGTKHKKIITGISINTNETKLPRKYKRLLKSDIYKLIKYDFMVDPTKEDFDPIFFERIIGKLNYWKMIEPKNEEIILLTKKVKEHQVIFSTKLMEGKIFE
jgi:RNA-directed DNA polymerase